MRKAVSLLLTLLALLSLAACGQGDAGTQTPAVTPEPSGAPPEGPVSPQPSGSEAGRYYDLFQSDPGLVVLFGLMEGADGGFTDDQLCAYAITALAVEGRYDYETGVAAQELDAIAQKHFGRSIGNFENSMTTVLDDGRVTATGWSFDGSVFLALDGRAQERDGATAARFRCYQLSDSVWLDQEIEQEKLDHIKDYLLSGDDADFPEPRMVEIVFEERMDEASQRPYVFYHSITDMSA